MTARPQFTVLIERRRLLKAMSAALASSSLLAASLGPLSAHARPGRSPRVAADLGAVIDAPTTPKLSFCKDVKGLRYVKALLVANSIDPNLSALRAAVIAAGGSVYMRYLSVSALSVMLPANAVDAIAARGDVQGISPNRLTARTASLLELATGTSKVRTGSGTSWSGLDGSGVGIAVLDSGIASGHASFLDKTGATSRVARAVDFQKVGDAKMMGVKDWTPGIDVSASLYPGSPSMDAYEKSIRSDAADKADLYGHGTHVASVAAARGNYQSVDSTGIAPNANLYDVRVLDDAGFGQMSDVLAGIDWVIYHAKEYNIRVMNLSLAADSTETYLTDPLCRAARSAVAAGITVVVAAGNYGQSNSGVERFGSIGAPAIDPSVITVGSANTKGTAARSDDTVNFFSSRGPTRGSHVDAAGIRRIDNLLKPDLVAPGNKIVGALGTDKRAGNGNWNHLASTYPALSAAYGNVKGQLKQQQLLDLSGTSVAAPVVAGAVALMLQANPGLTPPLIKAMLQYSAQPIVGASFLQQGAGLLNVDGAVQLAKALRTDIAAAVNAGTLAAGANLLAAGKTMPAPSSVINGATVDWGRVVFAGGTQIVSGPALFTTYQPIYDPRIAWVGRAARRAGVSYWPAASGVPANTFAKAIVEAALSHQAFLNPAC